MATSVLPADAYHSPAQSGLLGALLGCAPSALGLGGGFFGQQAALQQGNQSQERRVGHSKQSLTKPSFIDKLRNEIDEWIKL